MNEAIHVENEEVDQVEIVNKGATISRLSQDKARLRCRIWIGVLVRYETSSCKIPSRTSGLWIQRRIYFGTSASSGPRVWKKRTGPALRQAFFDSVKRWQRLGELRFRHSMPLGTRSEPPSLYPASASAPPNRSFAPRMWQWSIIFRSCPIVDHDSWTQSNKAKYFHVILRLIFCICLD